MKNPKIALLGMILESNRFARPADFNDFMSLTWKSGKDLIREARSSHPIIAKEFAAFTRAMDATGDWRPFPILLIASRPLGPVKKKVFAQYLTIVLDALQEPVDAVYLCHHGAMVAEHLEDPDGELMHEIRSKVGKSVPIVVTLDLHANISDKMCSSVDLICGYQTNPHLDMVERGYEAAFALRRILSNDARPKVAHVKLPLIPSSITLLTNTGPYREIMEYGQRRKAELGGSILNVSLFGNFIFSDVHKNGFSVVVTATEDEFIGAELAQEIAQFAWNMRERFVQSLTSTDEAIKIALDHSRDPIIFSDAGDNPGGGGSGRTTQFLRELVSNGADNVIYGSFFDPDVAEAAHKIGLGGTFKAIFNEHSAGESWEYWDERYEVNVEVIGLRSGDIVGRLGTFSGRRMLVGKCALLQVCGVKVVIISERTQTADPVFFEMFSLDISEAKTVVVKSRGHFRAGFKPWFNNNQIFEIDTPGLTSPVLERWHFRNLPRPSYPMDLEVQWPNR